MSRTSPFDAKAKVPIDLVPANRLRWAKPTKEEITHVRSLVGGRSETAIHLLTPREFRIARKDSVCHTLTLSNGKVMVVDLGRGLFCTSPEETLLELCASESFLFSLECCFELCGCYRKECDGAGGDLVKSLPLTTPAAIEKMLSKRGNTPGRKVLDQILRYVIPLSASPMETGLVVIFVLPRRLGGYGLPRPLVNKRVVCRTKAGAPSKTYYLDLYWPELGIALEYDSDEFHFREMSDVYRDSDRRTNLAKSGIETLSVTKGQVQSLAMLDTVAKAVAAKAGVRLRLSDKEYLRKREQLHAALFRDGHIDDIVPSECYFL
ncbi:MAG: hypothetical protein HFJ66_01055 [Eggerthellaceae bacterium]|nr:hypothetical protein [Eggerthellaceae bacterium]